MLKHKSRDRWKRIDFTYCVWIFKLTSTLIEFRLSPKSNMPGWNTAWPSKTACIRIQIGFEVFSSKHDIPRHLQRLLFTFPNPLEIAEL